MSSEKDVQMEDEDWSGSEMEVEIEFTEEDRKMREELEQAKVWLTSLKADNILTKDIFDPKMIQQFKQAFHANTPFPHYSIPNFVDSDYLSQLLDEIKTLEYLEKNNDLYNFSQSNDLKSVTTPLISKFKEVLYSKEICQAFAEISGIDLFGLENDSKPDFFAAVYNDTNRLLCHDDELEGRRIAFILYLVPEDWSEEDGGHLDLFNHDANTGLPTSIGKALLPRRSTFSFFEVSEKSYHQVREVLSANKNRVSIGGWFHGKPLKRKDPVIEPLPVCAPAASMSVLPNSAQPEDEEAMTPEQIDKEIEFWVGKQYRKPAIIKQAATHFSENSSIEMKDFLRGDRYDALMKELTALEAANFPAVDKALPAVSTFPVQDKGLEFVGPINLRCYYRGNPAIIDSTHAGEGKSLIVRFQQFLRSPAFFKVIRQLTTCTFSGNHTELRVFRNGCYTLSHDLDLENKQEGLDVFFTLIEPKAAAKWKDEHGGSIHYTREGQDEELLSCFPVNNTISIVYRGAADDQGNGVLQFVRYLDHNAPATMFQYYSLFRLNDEEEPAKDTKKKKKVVKRK